MIIQSKVAVTGGINLPKDEEKIAAWVAKNGPVSIGINAFMMQFYRGTFPAFIVTTHDFTTIQYQGLSAPLKPKNNPKINLKQNTNTQYQTSKPKNKSNSPNPQ